LINGDFGAVVLDPDLAVDDVEVDGAAIGAGVVVPVLYELKYKSLERNYTFGLISIIWLLADDGQDGGCCKGFVVVSLADLKQNACLNQLFYVLLG